MYCYEADNDMSCPDRLGSASDQIRVFEHRIQGLGLKCMYFCCATDILRFFHAVVSLSVKQHQSKDGLSKLPIDTRYRAESSLRVLCNEYLLCSFAPLSVERPWPSLDRSTYQYQQYADACEHRIGELLKHVHYYKFARLLNQLITKSLGGIFVRMARLT